MKAVKVEWEDAYAPGPPWVVGDELPDNPTTHKVVQLGFLVKQSKSGVWMAGGYTKDGALNNPFFIPAGMVKKLQEVKLK